ncbi:hypothetical protein BDD12DRAFT_320345 [Trichophaea hybrida]|nr:hypothetical protein BDD12DRAFT_320345 [Trichophaea hybrida]
MLANVQERGPHTTALCGWRRGCVRGSVADGGHGKLPRVALTHNHHRDNLYRSSCVARVLLRRLLVPRQLHPQPSRWSWLWPFGSLSSSSRIEFFPTLLDEFIINGPNGSHRCIVTEAL